MATPTPSDMRTSLEDARFFHERLDSIIRGPEQGHDLHLIRRYFRAYLHCWKCIPHFVREVLALKKEVVWIAWCKRWGKRLQPSDYEVFECLRKTRDWDTHEGMIHVTGQIAAGLFPIVMFQPGKSPGLPRELISCCDRGLLVAQVDYDGKVGEVTIAFHPAGVQALADEVAAASTGNNA
jgi:hypothetical protein